MKRTTWRRFVLSPVIVGVLWLLASLLFRLLATVWGDTVGIMAIVKNFINRWLGIFALISIVLLIIGIVILATSKKNGAKHFTIKEIVKYSWNSAKKNMSKFLLWFGIYIVLQIITSLFWYSNESGNIYLINGIVTLVVYIAMFRLWLGYKNLSLNIVNEAKAKSSDVFVSFRKTATYAGAYIFVYLIVLIWIILLIIPGIIFAIKLSMVPYLIIDKHMWVFSSIKASRKMTRGFGSDIFVLNLLCGLINIVWFLAVLVWLLRTIPLIMIANAYLYKKIVALQKK